MDGGKNISGTLEELLRYGFDLLDKQQYDEAAGVFFQLLNQFPREPNCLYGLATIAFNQKRVVEAKAYATEVLTVIPAHIASLELLAAVAIQEKNWPEAETFLLKRQNLEPDNPVAYFNLGYCFHQQNKLEEAKHWYEQALVYNPDYPACILNLAGVYRMQKSWAKAEALYDRALALKPDYLLALVHSGGLYEEQRRWGAAERRYQQALRCDPQNPDIITFLGVLNQKQGRYRQAEKYYLQALQMDPQHDGARFNFSLWKLLHGEFAEGWALNQSRKRIAPEIMPTSQQLPWWEGQPLLGAEFMYVLPEQGYGDYFMFIRFAQQLQALGMKVVAVHKPEMLSVLKTCPWLHEAINVAEFAKRTEGYQTMAGDLPGFLGVTAPTIPHEVPYLFAPGEKSDALQTRLAMFSGFKVGVCWAGSQHFAGDAQRSMQFAEIKALLNYRQVTWVNLTARQDALLGEGFPAVIDVSELLHDFGDTATVLAQLDLIITVDTAVAHLAGAMNRPCWVMLPKESDWRWRLNCRNSAWYPSITLFRQTKSGYWNGVVQAVLKALKHHLSKHPSKKSL